MAAMSASTLSLGLRHLPRARRAAISPSWRAESVGAKAGISVGVYQDEGGTVAEGDLVLHAGFEIGDQDVPGTDTVNVVDLPVVEVAAAVYRGGDDGIVAAWEALVRWIDDGGYHLLGDCRELYHEWEEGDPSRNVMEMQQPQSAGKSDPAVPCAARAPLGADTRGAPIDDPLPGRPHGPGGHGERKISWVPIRRHTTWA